LTHIIATVLLATGALGASKTPVAKETSSVVSPGHPPAILKPSSAPVTVAVIAERFESLDAGFTSLTAKFRQFVRVEGSDTVQEVDGRLSFRKPDLMRIEQKIPEPQTIVSDGTWMWVYRPSTNQVIKTKLSDWRRNEPLAKGLLDFGRSAELLKHYDAAISTVSAADVDGHRTFVVSLKPPKGDKASAGFELRLTASTRDFFPYETSLRVDKASITSRLDSVMFDAPLSDDSFRFTPPEKADVFTTPSNP
jgi:outer membrane lipoprotein carrier protein